MEFLANFGLSILAGMAIMFVYAECMMTYLSGNQKWRVPLTTHESVITITAVFTFAFLGGYAGVYIQEGFAHASSNLSLLMEEYTPPEIFTARAPNGEAQFLAGLFAALFSLVYLYINSYWIHKRRNKRYMLQQLQRSYNFKSLYSKQQQKLIQHKIDQLTHVLYKNLNGYCP